MSDIEFLKYEPTTIFNDVLEAVENGVSEDLYPGDERRLFAESLVPVIVSIFASINDAAKQSTMRYAREDVLDAIGEMVGAARIEILQATTIIRFGVATSLDENIIIAAGTRVTSDNERYFETTETATLQAGNLYVDAPAQSTEGGESYNGIAAGEITTLVDLIAYIDYIENTIETAGGGNKEDDDTFRERIRLAITSRSVAGPASAYKYVALSADTTIADALVRSDSPGEVIVTPLLHGGGIPDQTVLDKVLAACSASDVRPLTDLVTVEAPTAIDYSIDVTYYTTAADEASVVENVEGDGGAIDKYIYWQGNALSRDINPDYLRKLILAPEDSDENNLTGATRLIVTSPVYTELQAAEVAHFSGTININHIIE